MLVEFTVSRNDAGQRAERYLRRRLAAMSLDRLHSLFRRKEIKIARKPIKKNHLLLEDDIIQIYGLRPEDAVDTDGPGYAAAATEKALTAMEGGAEGQPGGRPFLGIPILHEDADLLVLDKPANLAVHPGTGIVTGDTVIEKVRIYLAGERRRDEIFQPSLVHRLDKDTSGVLVVAKTGESLRRLTESLRDGGFTKKYLALVEGVPSPRNGEISGMLQRVDSRSGGAKAEVSQEDGKWSVTRYRTVKDFGNFSLLGVIIETGRMHQIRAHLASQGHPLVGDPRYGSFERNRAYRKTLGLKRTFLHAADLEIDMGDGRMLAFHAPLPKDLALALDRIPTHPEIPDPTAPRKGPQ
ncbi:MAG: putative ribosomal large subunit pseudouridine synthase [Fibrobacteres bacterium]|nr:putative ribosomal large subunit pseudouridine synthase [Fibrobacterota bacterium]